MRGRTSFATLAAILALAACAGGATGPAALCAPAVVQARGATFAWADLTTPAEAGELYAVVQRERACEDVIVTVADSAYTPRQRNPWLDGDAMGLTVGTQLYVRVGSEPGQELVAEQSPGRWIRLTRLGQN